MSVRVYIFAIIVLDGMGGEWSKLEKHITYIYGRREEEDWLSKPHTRTLARDGERVH